jgi:hypothetical protein
MVNGLSEAFANGGATILLAFTGKKTGYSICYVATAVSCLGVMFAELHDAHWLVPLGVLVGKFSITAAFCFLYFTTVDYFESSYLGFAIGLCNVFGRASTILSPVIAEMGEPLPMMSCAVLCLVSFIMCVQLEVPESLRK